MQHQGHFHLDEVRHLSEDTALTAVLGLTTIPHASTLGAWLRKTGASHESPLAWEAVNKAVLQAALHRRKKVTLDIDATEVVANKADAHWTYNKNKGYMPMVGHIAETGQVVACDFRQGNAGPAKENFEFIQQCQKALPQGCTVGALRIDAAGYQLPPTAAHCAIARSSIGTTNGLKIAKTALRNLSWISAVTPCLVLILMPTLCTSALPACPTIYSPSCGSCYQKT
jgi:hypothetical protein